MFVDGTYVHTLSPFAIEFAPGVGIRWYGLAYLAGFLLGLSAIRFLIRKQRCPLSPPDAGDFVFTVALGTVIGGRVGYALFYNQSLFTSFSPSFPFWGLFALHEGGMASHGGIFGIVVACWWYGKRHGYPFRHLCDLTTLGGTIGIFFGRIANFINGELFGREAPADFFWAVKFPQEMYLWPTEASDKLAGLETVVPLIGIHSSTWDQWLSKISAHADGYLQIERAIGRLIAATQEGNSLVTRALAPLLTPRYPSQLYEALLEGLLLFVVLAWLWRKKRADGFIAGAFLLVYPLVRIFGEQFRLPDVQIGFQLFGLTRGQWLSIGMLILSAAFIFLGRRSPPLGIESGHDAGNGSGKRSRND